MYIRHAESARDYRNCVELVYHNWGPVSAERAEEQVYEAQRLPAGKWSPKFCVASIGDRSFVGFGAYQRSMRMHAAFDLIWLAVDDFYQGKGVGAELTRWRIAQCMDQGAESVHLVTQKPHFFAKFGFVRTFNLGGGWNEMTKIIRYATMGEMPGYVASGEPRHDPSCGYPSSGCTCRAWETGPLG